MEKKPVVNNRAYSVLDVKSIDSEKRRITGIATTPSVDRMGDIIEPGGVKFSNPMPLLWQHNHDQPIGFAKFGKATKDGIPFEAEIATIAEEGTLKNRIEEAWQSIKYGLVKAVSIGFRAIEYTFLDDGGIRFIETEVYELSAVTIPANADAVISTVKSIDACLRKEAGVSEPEIPLPENAASGKKSRVVKLDKPARVGAKQFVVRKINRTAKV